MKVVTIVGARPQFIKAAVVSRAFKEYRQDVKEVLVHTGQHYDSNMSDVFFDELDIPRPTHHLGVGGGTHGQNTGRMIEKIEAILLEEKPDWVLVYGDTDSTLAGAIAAVKLHIKVAHVEAGLRSFNRRMPEEINRLLTDHVSSLLLLPGEKARANLSNEGIVGENVHVVGDVMFDAAIFYRSKAKKPAIESIQDLIGGDFSLCTIHRAENTDSIERMTEILKGLASLPEVVVLPLHPRTRGRLASSNITLPENVRIVDPVGYLEMVWLEANSRVVLTDSGGVQKEAYFHGKYCVTLRDETEWVELVEAGVNSIVGASASGMLDAFNRYVEQDLTGSKNIYGDGFAAKKIVQLLV